MSKPSVANVFHFLWSMSVGNVCYEKSFWSQQYSERDNFATRQATATSWRDWPGIRKCVQEAATVCEKPVIEIERIVDEYVQKDVP